MTGVSPSTCLNTAWSGLPTGRSDPDQRAWRSFRPGITEMDPSAPGGPNNGHALTKGKALSNAMRSGKRLLAGFAATAVGVAMLTVVSAPAANAAVVASAATYQASTTYAANTNEGICAVTPALITPGSDDTVVDMVSTGTMTITGADDTLAADDSIWITVGGPMYIQSFGQGGAGLENKGTLSGDQRTLSAGGGNGSTDDTVPATVTLKPNGTGQATITWSMGATQATASYVGNITVNIGTSCVNGTLDVTSSYIQVMGPTDDTVTGATTSNIDNPAGLTRPNASLGWVGVNLRNAYGQVLNPTGTITASATNNAILSWTGTPNALSTSSASTTSGSANLLRVAQGSLNKNVAVTTTITLSFNGVSFATETIKFTGDAASITVSNLAVKPRSSTVSDDDTAFYYAIKDAAGNQLSEWGTGSSASAVRPAAVTSTLTEQITAVAGTTSPSSTTLAAGNWTCAATTGSSQVKVYVVTNAGTLLVSDAFTAACAGGVYTWTSSLDKAAYKVGEIATLTVEAKDSTGAAVNDFVTTGTGATAVGLNMSIIGASANDISLEEFSGGKATFQFQVTPLAVGQKEVKTNMVVSLPAYVATAGGSKAIPYEVTDGSVSTKTILIVGERGTVSGKPGILVDGTATGFDAGATVKPFVRFPGQSSYTEGSARPVISAVGDFEWQRKTGKKTYVYFTSDSGDVQSNRVIIPAK